MARITRDELNKARNFGYGLPRRPPGRPGGGGRGPDWATKQAMMLINAQVKAIEEAKRLYQEEYRNEAQYEEERGQALGSWLQQQDIAGKIGGIWGSAAGDVRGLGAAMGAAQAGEANTIAGDLNADVSGTGQEGTVAVDGGLLGDITYGTGGELPGSALDYTGKGWASDAALQPSFAARFSGQKAGDIRREGLKGLKDFFIQIAEARAQKPQLVMDLRDKRSAARAEESDRQWDRHMQRAAMYLNQGKMDLAMRELQLAQQKEARYQQDSNSGHYVDSQGRRVPKGYRYNKNGELVRVPTASSGGGSGSGVDWGDLQQDIANDVPSLTKEIPDPESYLPNPPMIEVPLGYHEAYQRLWAEYSGMVKNKGRLKRLIIQILAKHGIKKPPGPTPPGPK